MKKIYNSILILIFLSSSSFSQINLVPNSGFEDTLNCNLYPGLLNSSPPWFNPTNSSPDFYFATGQCGLSALNNTSLGFQLPKTGLGYSGVITFLTQSATREYIEVELNDTLKAGIKYSVEFYISRAEKSGYASDAIGAYFSNDSILLSGSSNFNFIPQVENPLGNIIYDTTGWVKISGFFIAYGGEKFLTIGNFRNNSLTQVDSIGSPIGWQSAYYYIDDVSVVGDTTTSISDNTIIRNIIIVYPNPASNSLTIKFPSELQQQNLTLKIIDVLGNAIHAKNISSQQEIKISTQDITNGIYFFQIITADKKLFCKKILIQH